MGIDISTAVRGLRWLAITMVCCSCAACTTTQAPNSKGYISEKVYGVKAGPRVAYGKKIPKGRGRYMVGKPYVVKGKRYYPKEEPNYDKKGVASWYGSAFRGRLTANGEIYDPDHLSAAHPTLPLPSYVRVTNLENGSSLIVRVNDRGPFHHGRIIDVSSKAADMLDLKHRGTGAVRVQYVDHARLAGHDMPYLMASYVKKSDRFPVVNPEPQIATGVMVAYQSLGDHLRSDGQSLWSTQTNFAGNTPSASYQTGTSAAAAFQTFEQFVMLPEIGHITFERPSEYALANGLGGDADVKYCLDENIDDGVRGMCEVQVLPLPGVNRNKRLTGVISIRRRRSCRRGHRWRGTQSFFPRVHKAPTLMTDLHCVPCHEPTGTVKLTFTRSIATNVWKRLTLSLPKNRRRVSAS
ncbi:septal ring lytic transglycosylase RlpA family protein [Pararhizobium sp. A13]|uniref:septal ring lytic transglycosylase RlpA family protein n=1 Tax=Pararhizobium sp. A13 TaxID=3133975 RepID=UPI00311AED03